MSLRRHVVDSHGEQTWLDLLDDAGMSGRLFTSLGEYPDSEVMALVGAASRALGVDAGDVLRGFGRSLARDLIVTYRSLVGAGWTAFDLLEHTEKTIHTVVRMRQPGAQPPVLSVTRRGPELVSVRYASARRLCALAQGIVLGVGDQFGTPLQVHETSCMLKGAGHCQIEVLPAFATPAPRESGDARAGV
jgi:predicted hydrocarbon binding protein